jgi:hypothetical protein
MEVWFEPVSRSENVWALNKLQSSRITQFMNGIKTKMNGRSGVRVFNRRTFAAGWLWSMVPIHMR